MGCRCAIRRCPMLNGGGRWLERNERWQFTGTQGWKTLGFARNVRFSSFPCVIVLLAYLLDLSWANHVHGLPFALTSSPDSY